MSPGSRKRLTMDVNQIMEVLPHRHPFLLVDRILDLEPGSVAVGLKAVTRNEAFFEGHFPGKPIMPGVLITEAMAQVGGVLLLSLSANQGKLAYLTGVDKQRFRKPVEPGDLLVIRVEMVTTRGYIGKIRAAAYVFRLETADLEHPVGETTLSSLPRNGIACIMDPTPGTSRERKALLGMMEGELAVEGELMFALMERGASADGSADGSTDGSSD
jgi:3-hydroxyacyl-[acyl-carrier-protein] dehydratase